MSEHDVVSNQAARGDDLFFETEQLENAVVEIDR